MNDILFLPVKPKWASRIMSGEKTLELRKRLPSKGHGNRCIIYATSPQCEIVGACTFVRGFVLPGDDTWLRACVSRDEFDAYFRTGEPHGLELSRPASFAKPISLETMRAKWQLEPPQQWRYIDGKTFDEIVEAGQ